MFLSRMSGLLVQAMISVMLITLGVKMGELAKIKINGNVFTISTLRLLGGPHIKLFLTPFFTLMEWNVI